MNEEYYKLYIGSKVFILPDECITDGTLDRFKANHPNGVYNPELTIDNFKRYFKDGYKLILRHLSDMTEDEQREYIMFEYPDFVNEKEVKPFQSLITIRIFNTCTPKQFLYLISKGFDLFNLIKDGHALNQTLINNNNE